jgi:multiple sugar transport system substrate-binding protein
VEPGLEPRTWDDVLRAGPKLKAAGAPLGAGISPGIDGTLNALTILFAYGASVQDEEGNVILDRPATVEAVKMATAIFRAGMTEEVLSWDDASDNRFLASGRGSLTLDPVSAIRTVEKQDPDLAAKIALRPPPAGSVAGLGPYLGPQSYVIWKFARNPEAAKRFLVDLAVDYREAFLRSEFYNMPAFPGSVPDLAGIVAKDAFSQPPGKYTVLADATTWSTNLGHPGDTNAAVAEVFNEFIVPKMFVAAARGEMSAGEAATAAQAQITPIFDKWRERGKV